MLIALLCVGAILTAVPVVMAATELQALPCSQEGLLHSIEGATTTSIEFINQTSDSVNIYWLNYNGGRQFYNTLAAGASYTQQTYVTHPWVVTDSNNQCIAIFL